MKQYSQAGQDVWVDEMLEHKTGGVFLDVGSNHPYYHSNTYALESERGWSGLMVDIIDGCEGRRGTFIRCDASRPDERLLFQYSQLPDVVDYLSLDVDDALENVLPKLPWEKHTFRVITVEHDVYTRGFHPRQITRRLLLSLGYLCVCGDVKVIPPGMDGWQPFEDWFCHPDLVNPDVVKRFHCSGKPWTEILKM